MQRPGGCFQVCQIVGDRYQVVELIGGGEITEVYKVKDTFTRQILALKTLREGREAEELQLSREFYYLSKISHPGVVAVYDYGRNADRRAYFTLEYFPGVPINRYFKGGDNSKLRNILVQVLLALDAIHAQGMIHGDLKPQHILVGGEDGSPRVKLLDFGFADDLRIGPDGDIRGTLGYIAPEVFKGVDADARADLYSLGIVLYETLTGIAPGSGDKLYEWLKKQYYGEFEPVRQFNPGVSEEMERLVMQLIDRRPERRPGSARVLIELLDKDAAREGKVTVLRRDLLAPGFVSREEPLNQLKVAFAAAIQGKPGVVCISGERGVGKSRLLAEFKFFAQLEGATVFSVEPAALGARSQSLVETILNLLRAYGQTVSIDGSVDYQKEGKYRLFERITQRVRALADSHRVRQGLILIVDDFELFDPTSLEFLRYLAFSLKDERLLLVVSGLKEKRFLELIDELQQKPWCRQVPIPAFTRDEVAVLVESFLGNLTNAEKLVRWLFELTGGNPLWVVETVYALVEENVIVREDGRWLLRDEMLDAFRLPGSITEVVRRRLEGLTPEEKELLEIGTAAAGPFTLEFLRKAINIDERALFNAISRLKALGFLKDLRGAGPECEPALILSSKILETVILGQLSAERRRENHRRVALALEMLYPQLVERMVFDLAHHWLNAGVKDRAFHYALRAGEKAQEWLLFEQASLFYETALSLSVDLVSDRERLELIDKTALLLELTGRFAEAIDLYRQGLGLIVASPELGREKRLLAYLLRRLGLVYQKQGGIDEALNLLNQALRIEPESFTPERVRLLADLGWSYCAAGDFARAEDVLTRALQMAEKLKVNDPVEGNRLVGLILYYFGVLAWSRYDFVLALQLAERSLDVYERIGDDVMSMRLSSFLAALWMRRNDTEKAKVCYQDQLTVLRKSGDVLPLLNALQGLGIIYFNDGEMDRAYGHFLEALGIAERIGDHQRILSLKSELGRVCFYKGDWERADRFLTDALNLISKAGEKVRVEARVAVFCNVASLKAARGDITGAEGYLEEAERAIRDIQNPDLHYYLVVTQAGVALEAERFEQARRFLVEGFRIVHQERDWRKLAQLYTLAGELRILTGDYRRADYDAESGLVLLKDYPSSREFAVLLRVSGLAKCGIGQREKGFGSLKRSIEILRGLGVKYELALSLFASARALQPATGSRISRITPGAMPVSEEEFEEARANLKEARELFQELGAKVALSRAEELTGILDQVFGIVRLKVQERSEYLKVFYQLSELMNLGLEREDFLDRVLDLVISVTRAERGVIFFLQGEKLVPVAARGVEHSTVVDATTVSSSVLRRVKRRAEPVISSDAYNDPRFNSFNSVIANKIRGLLCVPLVIEGRVLGTIYLDSRLTSHLFVEEDKNLLIAVANLLAATIDRSNVFQQLQSAFGAVREDILIDAASGLFLGRSPVMRQVYQVIDRIAPTDCTVLLTGETGTGKGVIARLIHQRSGRKGNSFVSVNCGTLPETLFESELFGHARGSFTGAVKDKVGLFETAHGGTIFLDEITNTTLAIQAKLLQVLEEKVIRRVGETEQRMVDIRLICATNKNLMEEVQAGRFREDLYYRMNVVTIEIPPLRERVADIPHLANYFLRSYATQLNKPVLGFDEGVMLAFTRYHWPGNVRELQNTIERAVIMTQNRRITLEDVGGVFMEIVKKEEVNSNRRRVLSKEEVINALKETNGNITRAAELLSTHRRQLQRLIKRYQINRNSVR